MARLRSVYRARRHHDQKAQVRRLSIVFAKEAPEDREAKKFRHVQNESGGEKTRKSSAVGQTASTGIVASMKSGAGGDNHDTHADSPQSRRLRQMEPGL